MKRIFLIGDSTCQGYGGEQYPQAGWGQMLGELFTEDVTVENRAVAGRSAKSYYEDGHLAAVLEELRQDDIVLIQFGINDGAKDKPERFLTADDFEALIKGTYLAEIEKRGAQAVLLTPLPTADWDMEVRIFYDDRELYAQRLREIAAERRLELIDAYRLTTEAWSGMPREEIFSHYLVCRPGESRQHPEGSDDRTHLKIKGARKIASLIAGEIKRRDIAGLGSFVKG